MFHNIRSAYFMSDIEVRADIIRGGRGSVFGPLRTFKGAHHECGASARLETPALSRQLGSAYSDQPCDRRVNPLMA
jgi:hypothetical protein